MLAVFPYYSIWLQLNRYALFLFAVQLYVQKKYVYSTISAFYIYNNLCAITMARTYFFPPFFSFTAPLTSLFSFFFFHCAFQFRYSLFFFPPLNQCCFFELTLRDIDSPYGFRTRFLSSLSFYYSFPFIFLLFRKLDFRMRFRLADEKDRFGKSRERNAAWNRFEENEQLEEAISFFISSSFSFFLFSFLLDEKQKDLFYLDTRYIHIVHVRFETCLACLILPYLIRRNGLDNFT